MGKPVLIFDFDNTLIENNNNNKNNNNNNNVEIDGQAGLDLRL